MDPLLTFNLLTSIVQKGSNKTKLTRVARSQQAITATSAQNHGHLGTFHGHQIFRYSHFTATFDAEIYLKGQCHEIYDHF